MKTTKQKIYENIILALSFLVFSGLILSVIDAYLNIKDRGYNLYKTMSLICAVFYGFVSYSLINLYTPELPIWIFYLGVVGIGANILAILTLISSRVYKFSLSKQVSIKHFRGEEKISTSSARA